VTDDEPRDWWSILAAVVLGPPLSPTPQPD